MEMEIGEGKVSEGPRQFLQETPTPSEEGSANICSNLPFDNVRTVAVETTPNPLSYWPPLSSASTSVNSSKETTSGSQNLASTLESSLSSESLKGSNAERIANAKPAKSKCSEVNHSFGDGPSSVNQNTKILHHNLPPIAGITSSHNYRGAREVHKHSQVNSMDVTSQAKKGGEFVVERLEKNGGTEGGVPGDGRTGSDFEKKESQNEPPDAADQSADCEIVEVPTSTVERPKTASTNSDHVFSVPAAVNALPPHSRTLLSPRIPTPFAPGNAPSPSGGTASAYNEALVLNVNSFPNLPAGSPSPSGRAASSPHFAGPSPSPTANVKCSSPSDNPRFLPSPHSNLSSPSNLHRFPSHLNISTSGDGSRMPSSPHHPQINPPSPSQRSLPYASHSNLSYLNTPRNNVVNNSSVQNFHPDSSRLRAGHESIDSGDRVIFKESLRQNQGNQNRMALPHTNHHSMSQSHASAPQRIEQLSDSQSCRNPFELPVSKTYAQSYQHQHHPHPQPQPSSHSHSHPHSHFGNYPNNARQPNPNHDHYANVQPTLKEHRPPGSTFYPAGFKGMPVRMTAAEKEPERHYDSQYKHTMNSQSKGPYSMDASLGSVQRRTDVKLPRVDVHRDFTKQVEVVRGKSNDVVTGAAGAWSKPEISDMGNKNAYLSTQNLGKKYNKVNGNEFSHLKVNEASFPNSGKQGIRPGAPEPFSSRYNAADGDKFNSVNHTNSLSQRFPPVPQSNYDLNRQIYDSMTGGGGGGGGGGGRPGQLPVGKTLEKTPFSSSREQSVANPQSSKCQPYFRDFADQDKGKHYTQTNPVKQNEYAVPSRITCRPGQDYRSNSYGQHNSMPGKTTEDGYQHKRQNAQLLANPGYHSHVQSDEGRMSQTNLAPDHRRPLSQSIGSGGSAGHHVPQTPCANIRSAHPAAAAAATTANQSMMPQKHQVLIDYESKFAEAKSRTNSSQSLCPPNVQGNVHQMPPNQAKGRTPSSAGAAPVRSKRESPLDLSVKTVRQSADSTAKDDGEVYLQGFRGFLQGSNQPHSESRFHPVTLSNNGSSAVGAPKIDFTPDFSGFHADNQRSPTPTMHHKSDVSILPPVESFKKFPTRLPPAGMPDAKVKTAFPSPKYTPSAANSQKPQTSLANQMPTRYPNVADHFKMEAQKRPSNDPVRTHSSQPKIPKIDPWKVAFDQQIEQRLNSARMNHQNSQCAPAERAVNGLASALPPQHPATLQVPRHSSNHFRGANMYPQPPIQTSAAPYNPSYVQQPQCQPATPQTPQEKIQHRKNLGHSPDPEQIIKQISKGVMPDHKLLQDKNVLSILRSSLEEKEAKLMQLKEAARKKEKFKELMTSDTSKSSFQALEQTSKGQGHGKQSLPPFGALTLERMCAPPSFPGHRLNLPRAVDAVKIDVEPTQKYFSPAEKSGIPGAEPSPQDDAQGPPTDLDGLAAFLAARIRTKGELKQVGPTLEPAPHQSKLHPAPLYSRPPDSLDRRHPTGPILHSSNLATGGSPPKLIRESRLLPPLRRRLFSHTEDETPTTSSGQTEAEQPALPPRDPNGIRSSSETSVFDFRESDSESEMPVLERQTLEGMRRDRKTFGSKQNVSTTTPEETSELGKPEVIPELETSKPDPFWDTAFDMFVEQLEKRPPKRSVRKKKIWSRTPFTSSEVEFEKSQDKFKTFEMIEEDEEEGEEEVVVEEEEEEGEEEEEEEEAAAVAAAAEEDEEVVTPKVEKPDESVECEVKKELEEKVKVDVVQDGHVKLSSSRLKNYRDEMLKEDRLKELKLEKENEKASKFSESASKFSEREEKEKSKEVVNNVKKEGENGRKEESGIKTRGKSKILEKESEAMDFESESDGKEPRSESESTVEDDDDSLSLSGLESESTDSEMSPESSNSNFSSFDDSENETVAKKKMRMQTRLQTRSSCQRQVKSTGMRLRSKPVPLPNPTAKPAKRKKKKRKGEYYPCGKKKPSFGDGSHFRPGWEEEFYKFKQQLRMPEKLISISRPPKRSSTSLPDLDPYRNSPSLDSSDVSVTKKSDGKAPPESDDSEAENGKQKGKAQETSSQGSDSNITSLLKSRNGKKSILNLLVNKYGKGHLKKQKELKAMNERKSPRILPRATNKPELLPTPGLGIGKENVLKDKRRSKDAAKKKIEDNDSVYLGYFRKKTVNNFKEAFKQKVGLLPQEFSPVVLKSRTRNQTRDLKKKATLVEVFGEERPASAPPLTREEETTTDQERREKTPEKKKTKMVKKVCGGVVTRGRGKLTRSGRPGLRSTAVLRSNKAVQISKRHLNSGRKRNMELLRIRAMASKKFSYLVNTSDASNQLPITKKRLKLRSVRRKFRSGFDYIRKKKKMKKDGDSADGSVKKLPTRPTSESVEDIQNEIKNWVINKGLGETILHRAARLGYTDVAAYCLEKMDCSPSPRDNAGYTPLHEACSRGHLEIAKLLLMYGASVSESAKGGIRPLHEAAENGFTELIRLLLSYGADPLLETYTGHTALSLVTEEEARRLIQHHLADVQGNVAPVWTFQGPSSVFDPPESGHDPLREPPSPHSVHSDCELEVSDSMLPPLYRLAGDRDPERRWLLVRDLLAHTKAKSKDVLLKQLGPTASVREMKMPDFFEQGKCCNLLGVGEKPLAKGSKVTLVPYDEKVRQLLGVEKVVV